MERIGLLSKDRRLKTELYKWIKELPTEFEFVDLGPPATGDPPEDSPVSEPTIPKLVIFDSTYGVDLEKMRAELSLQNVPWLAIGIEEYARNPHEPAIRGANDLLILPLDRSVFLQKVEYLLAGDASVTPSFLYMAKADLPIELAKPIHITHISETGCTIISPRHVAHGVEGTLVSKIFGHDSNERMEVRAIESLPCFDPSLAGSSNSAEPHFEVKLRFFGIRHKQLLELRKWISAHSPHGLPEIERFESEPPSVVNIALISPQAEFAGMIRSSLENLARAEIKEFQGFKRFRVALEATKSKPVNESEGPSSAMIWSPDFIGPKTLADMIPVLPHPSITLSIRLHTEAKPSHVEMIDPPLRSGETLLTANLDAWSRDLGPLTSVLSETDRDSILEAIEWVVANSKASHRPHVKISAIAKSPIHRTAVTFTISIFEVQTPARSALVKIQIEEATESEAKKVSATPKATQQTFEAILLDASLLSFDLKSRVQAVSSWLDEFDVKNRFGNRPPLLVFNAKEDVIAAQSFRETRVRQLVYDFNDRRHQAELFISMSRPELWTSPQLAVAGLKTELRAYLGRPAHAAAISEVSLVITDRVPMKKGSELLVLSSLWSTAPEGLWARLRSASQKGEGAFANEFIFFGASDTVQKEIRKFAREDYIKKKAQGQS